MFPFKKTIAVASICALSAGMVPVPALAANTASDTAATAKSTANLDEADVQVKDQTYDGTAKRPELKVVLDGKTLKEGTDYSVVYSNNVKVGRAKVIIYGMGTYAGQSRVDYFSIISSGKTDPSKDNPSKDDPKPADKSAMTLTAPSSVNAYYKTTYNLKKKLKAPAGSTFKVSSSNSKVVAVKSSSVVTLTPKKYGTANITVKATNKNYTGTAKKTVKVTVIPAKMKITSLKGTRGNASEGKISLSWTPDKTADHYQIQYSDAKNFKSIKLWKYLSTKDDKGKYYNGFWVKKYYFLKGHKYYVRIRAVAKSGSESYTGPWTVKSVTVK